MRRRIARTAAVVALALGTAPATAVAEVEFASAGDVDATFSYDVQDFQSFDLRLTIERAGETLVDQPAAFGACEEPFCSPGGFGQRSSVRVRDLDADSEPEVLLDLHSGGTHCCQWAQVWHWEAGAYRSSRRDFRDPGYRLSDIDADGRPELVSADARFAYRFASFAGSAMPVQVWHVTGGRFEDVTEVMQARVRADRYRWWKLYRRARGHASREPQGIAAAWAADSYRLVGRARTLRSLRREARRGKLPGGGSGSSGAAFVAELDSFLRRAGYARR